MAHVQHLEYCQPPLLDRPSAPKTLQKVSRERPFQAFCRYYNPVFSMGCAFPRQMAQAWPEGEAQRPESRGVDVQLLGGGSPGKLASGNIFKSGQRICSAPTLR